MNFILDLFTKKELMIIGVVLGVLVFIVLILTLIDILSKKKKENEEIDEMFNKFDCIEPVKKKKVEVIEENKENQVEVNTVNENNVEISIVNESNENVEKIEEIKVENKEIIEEVSENQVINQEVKQEEVNKLESVEYIEPLIMDIDDNIVYVEETKEETKTKAQEELLKITEELKNPKSLEDTLYNLEIMEEENAIISYQELLENTGELNKIESDTGDEPISIKEILNMYEASDEIESLDVDKEMSKTTINEAYKGDFTSSPYLSPIVGFDYDETKACDLAEIQLENTANLEKLDKEMRKTNEFLSILNDLKKNLD